MILNINLLLLTCISYTIRKVLFPNDSNQTIKVNTRNIMTLEHSDLDKSHVSEHSLIHFMCSSGQKQQLNFML